MKTLAIAVNTGREAIRNKVLYSILLFAFVLTGLAAAIGSVSIGDTVKFIKDFSLLSVSLFGVVTTVVLGVNLLTKELDRRTIYTILSKPVGRGEFLVGKYVGLLGTMALMMGSLSLILLAALGLIEGRIAWELVPVIGAMYLEIAVLLAVAIFFSSIVVTPALAGLFTIATFVAGRSAQYLTYFFDPSQPTLMRLAASCIYALLPHLDNFYVADRVVAGQSLGVSYYLLATLYAVGYVTVLLLLSIAIFRRREFV